MTNNRIMTYNKGKEVRCKCCHRLLFKREGDKLYIKCRTCKNQIEIDLKEPESQELRATED